LLPGIGNRTPSIPSSGQAHFGKPSTLGQHLQRRRIDPDGFRKTRGSVYVNGDGLVFKYRYDRHGWFLGSNG
jgi:hypothetical protein